jgi:hypothetical protein
MATPRKKKSELKKRGRKTKYRISTTLIAPVIDLETIRFLATRGFTDQNLADYFRVNRLTIARWKKKHPEFCNAIKEGDRLADDLVEASLYQRARGFEHPSEEIHFDRWGSVHRAKTVKKYAPDTLAGIYWLNNRRKLRWRDNRSIDLTNAGVKFESMTTEQLTAYLSGLLSQINEAEKK